MKNLRKTFKTPEYSGIWLYFDGDRLAFRLVVEAYLRAELNDAKGCLVVDENGPHWKSAVPVVLSYSHSAELGLLVFSRTHFLGVDIESESREFKGDPLKLAVRFFPAEEIKTLNKLSQSEQKSAFLKLWVQKEAYAKISRLGLAKTLEQGVVLSSGYLLKNLPVAPMGVLGAVMVKARGDT
jgi:phosphopantetheinyl transferase